MEVILKKTKITLGVIKQLLSAGEKEIKTYEVLGWVLTLFKSRKYKRILLYEKTTSSLVYMNYPNAIREDEELGKLKVSYVTDLGGGHVHILNTKEEQQLFYRTLLRVVSEAKEKGQIFY